MKNKLHESLRKIIQQEIAAALQEASTQTYSLEITAKNGKKTISKVPAESPVELNRIVTALKKSKNVSVVKVLKVEGFGKERPIGSVEVMEPGNTYVFAGGYITDDKQDEVTMKYEGLVGKKMKFTITKSTKYPQNVGHEILLTTKQVTFAINKLPYVKGLEEGRITEDSSQFKVGEIYRDKSGVEYQVSPMPDKFKGKWGADTLNVWVTNLDTDEKHFMPVTMLKDLKQVYVTPTAGRKMLGRFESVNEGPEEYRIGTIFTVLKSPDSKFMRGWKAFSSVMYEPKIQPKKGDKFEIIKPEFDDEHISFRNLNRPEEILKAYGLVGGDDIKNAVVSFPSKWFKELESKGYFKVDKIGTGNNVFDYKSTIGEGSLDKNITDKIIAIFHKKYGKYPKIKEIIEAWLSDGDNWKKAYYTSGENYKNEVLKPIEDKIRQWGKTSIFKNRPAFNSHNDINEGPEEMGAYRRLVVTSPLMDKIKAEYTKFMARPEVKTMYPVRFKMIDSPKPDTFVVDVEGDKATVVAIKLSDLAKKLDKSVAIMVRKERKLK